MNRIVFKANDIVEVRWTDADSERGIVVYKISNFNEYDVFFPDRPVRSRNDRIEMVGKDQMTIIGHLDISGVKLQGGRQK